MHTKFIEATDATNFNHGKFMVARFTHGEWGRESAVDAEYGHRTRLLIRCGWTIYHFMVTDLQTGEGAIFQKGGLAEVDLEKHRIWTCPMFPHFLEWLYQQNLSNFENLPSTVNLGNVPTSLVGQRGKGPQDARF